MEKTILVTGGCRFIGSYTVVELINKIIGTRPKFHQIDVCVKENLVFSNSIIIIVYFYAIHNRIA